MLGCAASDPPATSRHRPRPLVLVASARAATADEVVARLRRAGTDACAAHSFAGCLRVATAVGPDLVILDPALPDRLERLLQAHPTSARARVVRLSPDTLPHLGRGARPAPAGLAAT